MKKLFAHFDWFLLASIIVCLSLGLTVIKSVAPGLFWTQFLYAVLGLMVFLLFSQIDFQIYEKTAFTFYFFSLFFLLLTFLFGYFSRGAVRWIKLGNFTLQPSEIVKPFLLVFFAYFLSSLPKIKIGQLVASLCLLLLPVALIFYQPDLGSSFVIALSWLVALIASGIEFKLIIGSLFLFLLTIPLGWKLIAPYQKERIATFINPLKDPLGAGFTVIQAVTAIGSGQFWGRGLGWGTQSHLQFLPERHTDFIFASLSEELGFLGAISLIIVFSFLLWRILRTAQGTKDKASFVFCCGIFGLIFGQVIINIGMNLGLVPVTGIPLPLVSYGGSSLLSTMISLGMVVNIGRNKEKGETVEIR
jgi:rod shape determining protein RodA